MKLLLSILLYTISVAALEYRLTQESELSKRHCEIESAFKQMHQGYFKSSDGLELYYLVSKVADERGSIVIVNGRTESLLKYKELIYDLNQNGYSVYTFDHRGQGLSEREYKADKEMGYVSDFNRYVEDMRTFMQLKVLRHRPKKLFLLAHSMGGAIASLYLERYSKDFDAAALSSPMHQPNLLGELLTPVACSRFAHKEGDLKSYVLSKHAYDEDAMPFKDNGLTHSRVRYYTMLLEYEYHPKAKVGGPSVQWVKEACRYSAIAVENANKIEQELLLLHAQNDTIVSKSAQEEFCERVGDRCHFVEIEGAWHEMLIEEDIIRNRAVGKILNFFEKYRQ